MCCWIDTSGTEHRREPLGLGYVSSIVPDRSFAPVLLASLVFSACSTPAAPTNALQEPAQAPLPTAVPDSSSQEPDEAPPAANNELMGAGSALCSADSDALADARARYDALETLAQGLSPAAAPIAFVDQVKALYRHECLAVGRGDQSGLDLEMATGLEAKAYWEAGLDLWFRAYLDFSDGADDTVWLLPSQPTVVTALTRPSDPLARWMCSADPEDPCARRVAAWRSRAQRTFELFEHGGGLSIVSCDPEESEGPKEEAYVRWRACESKGLRRHASLPLGGLGAIEDGWVVVYGRRGHYQYCDELAALDLSSGAHYRFADCDHRPELDGIAAAAGAIDVETGTIPVELLQEFAWVALSLRYIQPGVVTDTALGRELPAGLRMARPAASLSASGFGLSGTGSSGHTTLGWLWTRGPSDSPADGELSWPDGLSDPADDHAVRLLDFAEQRTAPGCAAKKLPAWIVPNLAAERLPKRDSELVDPPSAAILAAVRRQLKKGRCAK
ncbi:MAG: hypothetical protein KUG77_17375 [Nannocystaceae bacterium]|nr:hypothetical protein [Nannocystaceae bacterium]